MLCNVQPSDGMVNGGQIIRHVQLPQIGTSYVGRELTITLHAVSGSILDNITVKPASDDVILYHGRMWDSGMGAGDHSGLGTSTGGDGMTMGHGAAIDINWASLNQHSVVSVTMVAVDHTRLTALLGGADIPIQITADPSQWATGVDQVTADVWLVTQVSGASAVMDSSGLGRSLASLELGLETIIARGA